MTRRQPVTAPVSITPVIPGIPPAQVLPRLAALQTTPIANLKQQWRELFGKEPPPFNKAYIQSRLAYRIQEAGLWRVEAGDAGQAGGSRRAAGRRQHRPPPHPRR
ncbi:DUF2924 domain-containing protein [Dankookia sp. P2]|uniref:DUF2924 domain-containing protein n=1 Tax=Dankookia sp. P2 TaxID=3423955 RepID=UPI003D67C01E